MSVTSTAELLVNLLVSRCECLLSDMFSSLKYSNDFDLRNWCSCFEESVPENEEALLSLDSRCLTALAASSPDSLDGFTKSGKSAKIQKHLDLICYSDQIFTE